VTRRYLAVAVAVGVGSTVCVVIQATLLGLIIQRVVVGHDTLRATAPLIVGLAAAFMGRAVLAWVGELAAHRTSAQVTSTLRRQLLLRAIARGPSWLTGERTGELTSSATQGIDALDTYFARYLPTAVLAALAPILLLAWVGWSDWPSFVVLAVTVSAVPVFMILLGLEANRHATERWAQLSGLAATFYDLLQGMATLRAFGRVHDGRATLEATNEQYRVSTMTTLRVAFLSSLALELLASVGTALVALFLGLRLLDGSVHLGTALAVLVLAPEVYLPLRRAGAEFHASAEGQAAAERILDILDEDEPVVQAPTATAAAPAAPAAPAPSCATPDLLRSPIVLSGVRLRYPERTIPTLDGADLVIAPGEHLVVIGESGSGKSTLLSLLLGFVEVQAGSLRIGGRHLSSLSMREWRRQIAWVPQHPYLISGSIADNLRIGDPGAGLAALTRSCELSGLSELVTRLPHGLHTMVGEGGLTLSAGERQRIALGRALLRDAPLVLLDEPTAHLDADRELALRTSLSPWLEDRTVVVAAHRHGLVGRVDRTLRLVGGHLIELPPGIEHLS
jgi:thiol reductant ABC exporter CydD subunit